MDGTLPRDVFFWNMGNMAVDISTAGDDGLKANGRCEVPQTVSGRMEAKNRVTDGVSIWKSHLDDRCSDGS